MDLKEEDILAGDVNNHWYYRAKSDAMLSFLSGISPTSILDIGAGSGFFSREILLKTNATLSTCVDTGYQDLREEVLTNKRLSFRRDCGNVDVDLVLMMDVIEHVANDAALIAEYTDKVPSGTYFLITAPAFEFLWSHHDEFLGHRRRYTLKQMNAVVRSSGLVVQKSSYFFAFIFPVAALTRILSKYINRNRSATSDLKNHSAIVNSFLYQLCRLEIFFMSLNRFFGLTAFCLAKKQ